MQPSKKYLDSIEKFEGNQWQLLSLNLIIPSSHVGLMCIENGILLLGGKTIGQKLIDNIFYIDTIKLEVKEKSKLSCDDYFKFNHVFTDLSKNLIAGCNNCGNFECFDLDLKKIF